MHFAFLLLDAARLLTDTFRRRPYLYFFRFIQPEDTSGLSLLGRGSSVCFSSSMAGATDNHLPKLCLPEIEQKKAHACPLCALIPGTLCARISITENWLL